MPEAPETMPVQAETEPAPVLDEDEDSEEAAAPEPPAPSGPTGLYSDRTGFGWESYMLPRVDNEILRCTKSSQDISVISLRIDGIDWTSEEGRAVSENVRNLISSPDLIFEKGDDAFTWMDRLCNDSNYTPHGVYDIRVSNNHVDVVYGLYWWD